jgi:hypothetical protein
MRNLLMSANAMIQWSDVFVGEDGLERQFEDFSEGEMICHKHENRSEIESVASAVIFPGCFYCHVCLKTYYVLSRLAPDPYPFEESEIHRVDCVKAFLPKPESMDWATLLQKKYLVIAAPMGTGKTSWLSYLTRVGPFRDASVCVVTHRSLLALQIAAKCGLTNYLDEMNRPLTEEEAWRVNKWTLQDADRLVVVINSLWRLGPRTRFKVVIGDETGLVQRHFTGSTLSDARALEAYATLMGIVNRADQVVLTQEGLERGDVGFFTGMDNIDPEDRRYVTGYKFEKPI